MLLNMQEKTQQDIIMDLALMNSRRSSPDITDIVPSVMEPQREIWTLITAIQRVWFVDFFAIDVTGWYLFLKMAISH